LLQFFFQSKAEISSLGHIPAQPRGLGFALRCEEIGFPTLSSSMGDRGSFLYKSLHYHRANVLLDMSGLDTDCVRYTWLGHLKWNPMVASTHDVLEKME